MSIAPGAVHPSGRLRPHAISLNRPKAVMVCLRIHSGPNLIMTSAPDEKTVLAKAALVAARKLGLELTDISQMYPDSQAGERALLLVRLSMALSQLCGDDPAHIANFMGSPNKATGGVPAQQASTAEGLASVLQFAEALAKK